MNKKVEALEVHQELNQKLFNDTELKEDVKNKLLEIANTFIEGLDFPINVADIRFLGSNASYNYNEHSDIDLHIISNFDLVYVDKNILQQLYNASKNSFNNNHDITIKGIPVEIYIEDMNSMNATNGSYSLLNDGWIKFPQPIEYEIPDYSKELQDKIAEINQTLLSTNKEEIEYLINDIYLGRKDGLATEGEVSIGNLVFKELRNQDLIQKLRDRYNELESEELTLENKLVEAVEENATKDGQIVMKEKEYREYIDTHIENVKKAYDRIVKQYAEDYLTANQLKQLEKNIEEHDKDKNIPFMFDAYRRNHCPINDEEKEAADEDYDIAWSYHKTHNPHHWEYWLNSEMEFADTIDEDAMKLAYLEMLCDWLSFGFRREETSATGESTEFKVWYEDNKEDIKIHPQLEKWFSGLISQVLGYIKQEGQLLYESKPLTEDKTCGKIEEDVINNNGGENKMNYKEFKDENGFKLDYNVTLPLIMKQEVDFDTYEDESGRDIEMDYDVDSLMESFADAEKYIDTLFSNEDYLKEIFPNVGRGRVYPELISLEEDKLVFNIGFSDIVDPVEEGNNLNLNEEEIKTHIEELAENVIDNLGYLDAKQFYDTYSGYQDEDDDPIYDTITSDDDISFCLYKNGDIQIKSNLTESRKLEEGGTSRIVQLAQQGYFATISAELSVLRYARVVMKDENIPDDETYQNLDKDKQVEILDYAREKYGKECDERNKQADDEIRKDIRGMNFGYTQLQGKYTYADGSTGYEKSYFVSAPVTERSESIEKFRNTIIGWGKHFNQESVIVGKEDKSNNKDAVYHTYDNTDSRLSGDETQQSKGLTISAGLYDCNTGDEWLEFSGITINDLGNNLSKLMQGTKESQSEKRSFEFFTESLDRIQMPWDDSYCERTKGYIKSAAGSRLSKYRTEFEESLK